MTSRLQDVSAYPPRGMRAPRAAAYVGMSESSFLALVADGVMPQPLRIKGMTVWDRFELDAAFESLKQPDDEPAPPRKRNTVDAIFGLNKDND